MFLLEHGRNSGACAVGEERIRRKLEDVSSLCVPWDGDGKLDLAVLKAWRRRAIAARAGKSGDDDLGGALAEPRSGLVANGHVQVLELKLRRHILDLFGSFCDI